MAAAVPGTDWTDGPETLNADETHEALLVALRQLEDRLTQDSALFKERHAATAEMNKYSPGASIPLPVSLLGREGKGLLENVFSPEELIQISSSTHSQDQSLEYVDNASERALERQIAASRRLALLYASDPSPRSTLIEATANIATLYAKRSMYTQAMERANDALSLTERLDEPQVDPNLLARLHIYVALGRISQSELKAAHANLQVAETYSLTAQFSGTTEGRGSLLEIFYTTKGQLAVAEQKYSAAIQIYEDMLGNKYVQSSPRNTIRVLRNLAELYGSTKAEDGKINETLLKADTLARNLNGISPVTKLQLRLERIQSYAKKESTREMATQLAKETLSEQKSTSLHNGPEARIYARIQTLLCQTLFAQKDYNTLITESKSLHEALEALYGPDSAKVLECQILQGKACLAIGRPTDSAAILRGIGSNKRLSTHVKQTKLLRDLQSFVQDMPKENSKAVFKHARDLEKLIVGKEQV